MTTTIDHFWLSRIIETSPQLTAQRPIGVETIALNSAAESNRLRPESHPCCEIGLLVSGGGNQYAEAERALRGPEELFLVGPGVPHWLEPTHFPLVCVSVHFLPSLLCESCGHLEKIEILRRFTARRSLRQRLFPMPPPVRCRFARNFACMVDETARRGQGYEIRLRALLLDMLVDLLRLAPESDRHLEGGTQAGASADVLSNSFPSKESPIASSRGAELPQKWRYISQALQFLQDNHAGRITTRDVARATGLSDSRLKALFQELLGFPMSHYLQQYRIRQVVALLASGECNITEASVAAGFNNQSHFNATFRDHVGVSPRDFLKVQLRPRAPGQNGGQHPDGEN